MASGKSSVDLLLETQSTRLTWIPTWHGTAGWLEQQSATILRHLEPASSDNPGFSLIDPNHLAEFPNDGGEAALTPPVVIRGRLEYMKFRAKLAQFNPGIRLEVVNAVSNGDEERSKATVYTTCHMSHYRSVDRRPRESVVWMDWERQKTGQWTCVRSRVIQGYSYQPAFVEREPSAGGSSQDTDSELNGMAARLEITEEMCAKREMVLSKEKQDEGDADDADSGDDNTEREKTKVHTESSHSPHQ